MAETPAVIDMLDTIGANAAAIPKGTRRVAAYVTGSGGIAWSSAEIDALAKKGVQFVARIDQTNAVLSLASIAVLVKDIEPGASTNLTADHEAAQRARLGLRTTLYCMVSDFETLRTTVSSMGIQTHVDYWVADWNLDRQSAISFMAAHPEVVAVQWASPTSNPGTLVPGSRRTLAEANIDLSVTRASWPMPIHAKPTRRRLPRPKLPAKPHIKVTAAGIGGVLSGALLAYLNSHGAHVTHLTAPETDAVTLVSALLAAYFTPVKP